MAISKSNTITFTVANTPSWIPSPGKFANISFNTANSVAPNYTGQVYSGSSPLGFASWTSGIYTPYLGGLGSYLRWGGGQQEYAGNEVYRFDLETRYWTRLGNPSNYSNRDGINIVTINNGGTGYANGEALVFTGGGGGSVGTVNAATGYVNVGVGGVINSVTLTSNGSNYGYNNVVVGVTTTSGVGAILTANISINIDGAFPDGKPAAPRTYQTLGILSPFYSGNANGAMIQATLPAVTINGNDRSGAWWKFDLSTNTWSKFINSANIAAGSLSQKYMVQEPETGYFWWLGSGSITKDGVPVIYRIKSDGDTTNFPIELYVSETGAATLAANARFNTTNNRLLVVSSSGYSYESNVRLVNLDRLEANLSSNVLSNSVSNFTVRVSGTPAFGQAGIQYCPSLGKFASMNPDDPTLIYWLTPPSDDIWNGTWKWTTEAMSPAASNVRAKTIATTVYRTGGYNRFVWADPIKSFIWAPTKDDPVQAYRPTGNASVLSSVIPDKDGWALLPISASGNATQANNDFDAQGLSFTAARTTGGTISTLTDLGGSAVWDNLTGRMLYIAGPAGASGNANSTGLLYYKEDTDTWGIKRNAINVGSSHSLYTNAIDLWGRRIYKQSQEYLNAGIPREGLLNWVDLDDETYTSNGYITTDPGYGGSFPAASIAIHRSGRDVWRMNDYGVLKRYNITNDTWYSNVTTFWSQGDTVVNMATANTFGHSGFMHYDPGSDIIVGGGGIFTGANTGNTGRLFTIDNSYNVRDRGPLPTIMAANVSVATNHAIVLPHPTESATLAYLSNGAIFQVDHTNLNSNTFWTWKKVGDIPSTYYGTVGSGGSGDVLSNLVGCSIPNRCVLFLERQSNGTNRAFVHKPGPSTIPLPATLLLSNGANGKPWTVGQVFKKGDVPAGYEIKTKEGISIQTDIRNRWDDNSLRFAVLSGIGGTTINYIANKITPNVDGSGITANVSEPVSLNYDISFAGDVAGQYTIPCGSSLSPFNRTNSGLVRSIPGPVMSEFHYYRPTSNAQISLWFYVRSYSTGNVEIETVVENGWLDVASPGHRTYNVTVNVGGTTKFSSNNLIHRHHTRWSRADWIGNDPNIVPRHDMEYIRSTKLMPNYGFGYPASATLDLLYQDTNPKPNTANVAATGYPNIGATTYYYEIGNYTPGYSAGGDKWHIGLFPTWTAFWASAPKYPDTRAVNSVIANGRVAQRYACFYRDQYTGRPPLMASNTSYANYGLNAAGGLNFNTYTGWDDVGNSITYIPATAAGDTFPSDQIADRDHAAQDTYAPYILSGRWSFLDHAQMKQLVYPLLAGSTARNYNSCWFNGPENRGRGWIMRDCAMTISITPDSDTTLKNELKTIWQTNQNAISTTWATSSNTAYYEPTGCLGHYSSSGDSAYSNVQVGSSAPAGTYWYDAAWQQYFNVYGLAFAKDIELPVSSQAANDLTKILDHVSKTVSGPLGDGSPGTYNYRRAAMYGFPFGTDGYGYPATQGPGVYGMVPPFETKFTWSQIYNLIQTDYNIPRMRMYPSNTALLAGSTNSEISEGYLTGAADNLGHLIACASLLADKYTAVREGLNRIFNSSSWKKLSYSLNDYPRCGILPRQ